MSDVLLLGERTGEEAVAERSTFIALYSRAAGYVVHVDGRSFRCVSCPTDCARRKPYSMTEQHGHMIPVSMKDIGEAPANHIGGACFECSGVEAPAGWSQAERQAYRAEITASAPTPLRVPTHHVSLGEVGSRAQRRALRPGRN